MNLLHNARNKPSKFGAKYFGTYDKSSQIDFENLMLKPSLCGYINAHILLHILVNKQHLKLVLN